MKLIDYVKPSGAQTALAKLLGVPPVLVNQWANKKRAVPLDRCVQIEQVTNRAVTCEELRPDKADYWAYLRASGQSTASTDVSIDFPASSSNPSIPVNPAEQVRTWLLCPVL